MTRTLVALLVLASFLGVCLQVQWDRQCAAHGRGTTWNADEWRCTR